MEGLEIIVGVNSLLAYFGDVRVMRVGAVDVDTNCLRGQYDK